MVEAVDSSKDAAGKQYRATVTKPVSEGGTVVIPQASPALVTITQGSGGWTVQLASVTVGGQAIAVASDPGALPESLRNAANAASSALSRFGIPTGRSLPPSLSASGDHVYLRPGTTLDFANALPSGAAPAVASASAGAALPSGNTAPAAAAAPATPAAGGTLGANVQETPLGPSMPAGAFVVSPDGGHYAAGSAHGSREIVIVDGVPGPDFDHAGNIPNHSTAVDVAFSRDGKHSAYLAQRGNDLVAVKDGKEAFVVVTLTSNGAGSVPAIDGSSLHSTLIQTPPHQFIFSASGTHYATVAVANIVNSVFLDGVKGPDFMSVDTAKMGFVGEKLVYVAVTADRKWHVVVDRTPGPAYDSVTSLVFSDNDEHYAFVAQTAGNDVVVADGVTGTPRKHAANGVHNVRVASNGRVAYLSYVANTTAGHGDYSEPLIVDEKQVEPNVAYFSEIDARGNPTSGKVIFSPDGKRIAYAKTVAGGVAAVIDGKQGGTYDSIGVIQFSPDSGHSYFVGQKNALGSFLVVDGKEMPVENRIDSFVFSPNGARYAFQGYNAQLGLTVTVDGKQSPRYYNVIGNSIAFSPDSKHVVYAACTQYAKCQIIADGAPTNVPDLYSFGTRMPPRINFPPLVYSPDGSKLAYGYPKSDGTSQTVITVNGQEVAHGTYFTFRTFSPDSQHFALSSWNGKSYSIIVDGKVGPAYDDLLEANANVFRFLDAHTLQFLGVKGGQVYRVVVTVN